MRRLISGIIAITLLASLGLASVGCATGVQASTGTIEVRITDAPPEYDIASIDITFSKVEIHKAAADPMMEENQEENQENNSAQNKGQNQQQNQEENQEENQEDNGEWITIEVDSGSFDLLQLQGEDLNALLATGDIEAGKYTQIRVIIDTIGITLNGDEESPEIILPSGKLKFVRPFEVFPDKTTTILLDFDAAKSVVVTGNGKIIFKPVVKLSVSVSDKPEFVQLDTTGEATAEWSMAQSHSGNPSIHLETLGVPGGHEVEGDGVEADEATIIYSVPTGTTLGDITSISWWEYLMQGYPPHLDIVIEVDSVEDRLVFEYAYNDEEHCDEAPMPYGAITETWAQTFSDDTLGPTQIDDEANGWLGSGPPGPLGDPSFIYYTLAEWKAGIDVDGDTLIDINEDTPVLALEIEIDNWVVQSEAYVDDIVVNLE